MMQRTVALLLCACSAAQETATKEPRKVEFEAVVNEEGGRAAFSWTEGEDVTEKATQYCKCELPSKRRCTATSYTATQLHGYTATN